MRLPRPLDDTRPVFGRGWIRRFEYGDFLVRTPGERPADAGVSLLGLGPLAEDVRYDVTGCMGDRQALRVNAVAAAEIQTQPDLRSSHLKQLGCRSKMPMSRWRELTRSWAGSPLNRHTVWSWTSTEEAPGDPSERLVIGKVAVVRWVTSEIYEWVRAVPPPNTVYAAPIVANEKGDLLPW